MARTNTHTHMHRHPHEHICGGHLTCHMPTTISEPHDYTVLEIHIGRLPAAITPAAVAVAVVDVVMRVVGGVGRRVMGGAATGGRVGREGRR